MLFFNYINKKGTFHNDFTFILTLLWFFLVFFNICFFFYKINHYLMHFFNNKMILVLSVFSLLYHLIFFLYYNIFYYNNFSVLQNLAYFWYVSYTAFKKLNFVIFKFRSLHFFMCKKKKNFKIFNWIQKW